MKDRLVYNPPYCWNYFDTEDLLGPMQKGKEPSDWLDMFI